MERLGAANVVCIGNGRNDCLMLAAAALGIVVAQEEGACIETLLQPTSSHPMYATPWICCFVRSGWWPRYADEVVPGATGTRPLNG